MQVDSNGTGVHCVFLFKLKKSDISRKQQFRLQININLPRVFGNPSFGHKTVSERRIAFSQSS